MGLFKREKKVTSQNLTHITRGLHHAASSTSAMLAQQYLYMFEQYFDLKENGQYDAKTVHINLPDNKIITVPLISLVHPKGLSLENMKVALSVKVGDVEIRNATNELDGATLKKSHFKVELSPKGARGDKRPTDLIDIEMEFKAFDPPEGIMRAIDQFTHLVAPHRADAKTEITSSDEVSAALLSIKVATDDPAILKLLARFGYNIEILKNGMKLCNKVRQIEQKAKKANIEIEKAKKIAHGLFSITFKIAGIAFQNYENFYQKLQLEIIKNTTDPDWFHQANNFYSTLLGSEEYLLIIKRYGYEKDPLVKEFDLVKRVDVIETFKTELLKSPELAELPRWIKDFKSIARISLRHHPDLLSKVFPDTSIVNAYQDQPTKMPQQFKA